jgi:hypothetical protein
MSRDKASANLGEPVVSEPVVSEPVVSEPIEEIPEEFWHKQLKLGRAGVMTKNQNRDVILD